MSLRGHQMLRKLKCYALLATSSPFKTYFRGFSFYFCSALCGWRGNIILSQFRLSHAACNALLQHFVPFVLQLLYNRYEEVSVYVIVCVFLLAFLVFYLHWHLISVLNCLLWLLVCLFVVVVFIIPLLVVLLFAAH